MKEDIQLIYMIFGMIAFVAIIELTFNIIIQGAKTKKNVRIKNYRNITIGMSEEDLFELMGRYNSRLIAETYTEYEWVAQEKSYGTRVCGTELYSTEQKKVVVKVVDGKVTEIRPYNI